MNVAKVYEDHVRSLSPADQLRLVAHIAAKAAVSAEASPAPPEAFAEPPDPSDAARWSEWLEATGIAAGERHRFG